MVSTFEVPYFRQTALTVDTHALQKFFEEDDSILDDSILDQSVVDSALEMSPPIMDSRRESFAVGAPLFSPKQEDWQSVDMQSVPSNNPFVEPQQQSNNPFLRLDQQQQQSAVFAPHNTTHSWPMSTSGAATPLQSFDGLPSVFDANTSMFHRPAQTPFSNPTNQVPMFPSVGTHSIPTSPQRDHWMGGHSVPMTKKLSQGSPTFRSHNELRRGDGIRKKNARFDIPAERNLTNIDNLISVSTDEQEIKELKQQKRLLRNRQAALDSRQRKKQHTERLEDEKKQYTHIMAEMEDDMDSLRRQVEELMRDNQNCNLHIEKLKFDKEEMIQSHTIETGELRKKISVLTNHIHTLEASPMASASTMPSTSATMPVEAQATSYSSHFGEMEGLTMDGSWEPMHFLNHYAVEPRAEVKQEMTMVPATKKPEVSLTSDSEKPAAQGGLLFMLFLVGAFVLSSRQTPSIPRVSEDVRVASATLLENVLKDAGLPQTAAGLQAASPPQPSGTAWGSSASAAPRSGLLQGLDGGVAASILGELSDSLTQPSMEQTNEQLFSLSAAQYNGVASQDFLSDPHHGALGDQITTSQGRRNLADALSSMRTPSKADVYTRSLLWDQIPSDVVRTFAKMVVEGNTQELGSDATPSE